MNSPFDSRCVPALQRVIAVLCVAVALAACSRDLSAQSAASAIAAPLASATAPASTQAAAPVPSPAEPLVRSLPDFSTLVDRYGPAVVNVEVVEKAERGGGVQGLSPNDPFYDFFKRFGMPAPDQGQREHQPR